jgi:SAM-dependent methyltransferase
MSIAIDVADRRTAAGEGTPSCPACGAAGGPALLHGPDRFVGGPGEFSVVRCSECALAFTWPRLEPEDFGVYYPDDYQAYQDTDERETASPRRRAGARLDRLRLATIIRLGPYRPLASLTPGRLLDVGCGAGQLAGAFARRGWSVSGVEPSQAACRLAAARQIDIFCGVLDDAPWVDGSFDAIVFNHSLEHIPSPQDAVDRAARLLRPGGVLAIAVPNFGCWQRRLFGDRWFPLDLPRHQQHFEAGTLRTLTQRAGLRHLTTTTASMRPALLLSLQYRLFGRARFQDGGFRIAAWLALPFLLAADALSDGDCVHVFAQRP